LGAGASSAAKVEVQIIALDPAHVVKPSFRAFDRRSAPCNDNQFEQGYLEELEILGGMATMIKVARITGDCKSEISPFGKRSNTGLRRQNYHLAAHKFFC
jgi:hypothetical protein